MSSMIKAPNSACSPVLWLLHAGAVVAGAINYESTPAQAVIMVVFAVLYVQLHRALTRSREKQRQLDAALAAALAAE
jgi:membrane protein implicated in regulation of membrane protease activity